MPYITGAVKQYLRDKGHTIRLTQRIQTLETQGRKAIETLTTLLGRKPTTAEVALHLQVSEEEYTEAIVAVYNSRHLGDLEVELEGTTPQFYDFNLPEMEAEANRLWELRVQTEQSLIQVLGQIYMSDLWKNHYDDFLDYFKSRFSHWGRSHIYRMKNATVSFTDLVKLLSPQGETVTEILPHSEGQLRELAGLSTEQKLHVWRRAREIGGAKASRTKVASARKELIPSGSFCIGEPVLANNYVGLITDLAGKVYVPAMASVVSCSNISSIPTEQHHQVKQICDRITALKSLPLSRGVAGFLDELSKGVEYSAQDLAVLNMIEQTSRTYAIKEC